MKKLIGYCGLDCEKCDAYIATINNDQELYEKTAKLWSQLNQTEITPEQIRCEGCRMDGIKSAWCGSFCEIRKCAEKKGFETCGSCPEMDGCPILNMIVSNSPEVLENLKNQE